MHWDSLYKVFNMHWSCVVEFIINLKMDLKKLGLITRYFILLLFYYRSIALQMIALQAQKIKIRHWWIKPNKRRWQQGFLFNLFCEIRLTDHEEFFAYTRL